MRNFFVKVLSLTVLGLTFTSIAFGAASTASEPSVASARTLPSISTDFLRGYLPPADNAALIARVHSIPVIEADVYGAVASELAYKAAKNSAKFQEHLESNAPLSAEYLASIGDTALTLFAGWRVVGILDTTGATNLLDPTQTDLFALTLQASNGFKITAVRGTDKQSIHNILIDLGIASHHDVSNLGATYVQKKYPIESLLGGILLDFVPDAMKGPTSSYVKSATSALGYAGVAAAQQAILKLGHSAKQVSQFLQTNESDMAAGHSLGGILVHSVLPALEKLDGPGAAMAKNVQYAGNFSGMGTQKLIPAVMKILNPDAPTAPSAAAATDPRYRDIYRRLDAVGGSGKHYGICIPLGNRLSDAALGIVPSAAAAGAGAGGSSGAASSDVAAAAAAADPTESTTTGTWWTATMEYTSGAWAATAAAATTATTYVKAAALHPVKSALAEHDCHALMRELLIAHAHKVLSAG